MPFFVSFQHFVIKRIEAVQHLSPTPPQEFCKKTFHLSGYGVTGCNILDYGVKDGGGILQFSFRAENDEKFSAKRFFNLSRMIFRSAPN